MPKTTKVGYIRDRVIPIGTDLSSAEFFNWVPGTLPTTDPTPEPDPAPEINLQTPKQINEQYQQYFGRDATAEELAFWGTQESQALTNQLETDYQVATGHEYDDSPIRPGATGTDNDLGIDGGDAAQNALLESLISSYPEDQQALLRAFFDLLPETTAVTDEDMEQEILNTFNALSSQIVDPFFNDLIRQTTADITLAIERGREDRLLQQQIEIEQAQERFRLSQLGLEQSGLTRSGDAVRQLGAQSAARGATGEGSVPRLSRRIAEGSSQVFQRGMQDIGIGAENLLGSQATGSLAPEFNLRGDIAGSIANQRQTANFNLFTDVASNLDALSNFQSSYS